MPFDPKIEKTLRGLRILSISRQEIAKKMMVDLEPMREARSMVDYVKPLIDGAALSIRRPIVLENTFEINPVMI